MNKKFCTLSLSFLIFSLIYIEKTAACGFDFTGSCATTARFSVNNISTEYYISACEFAHMPSSLGTGITQFQLTDASTRTWESCTNTIMQGALFYRIYKDSLNKGAFIKVDLTQMSLFNSPPYRTKTYSGTPNNNLLQGLSGNTVYALEMYYQAFVDTNDDNKIDTIATLNNDGAYYKTSFQTGNISSIGSFTVNGTTANITCKGGNNGSATAISAGGKAPFTYLWSNNAITATISNLTAGAYSVTITDSTKAIGVRSFNITEPAQVGAVFSNTNPACGQTNGASIATGVGGTAPYSYTWSTSATTLSLANLAQGTYTVTVKDVNNCTGSASTTLIENCGNSNTYCASNSQAPWNEWIAQMKLNTLDNASDKTRSDRYALGYSDWKDKSTTLTKGTSYPLSITPGLSWSGYQTLLFYRVWIDFNKNGSFEDSEKVFEQNKMNLVAANGSVVVPASALLGSTTMRVSMKKDAYPTPCETFGAGEVEDYNIFLQAASGNPCANDATPPSLSTCPQNITLTTAGTTALATWTAPTATDNCTATPTLSSNFSSGQSFSLGNTTVIYTAKDSSNNIATCRFTVSISKILAIPTIVLKNSSHSVQKNEKICTSVTVDSFSNIISAQWVSLFNPSVLRFDSLINVNTALNLVKTRDFGTSLASAGEIRFGWSTPTPVSRPNGEKLYDMCFTAIGNGGTTSAVRIDSAGGTIVEIANDLGQPRAVKMQNGLVSVIDTLIQKMCEKYAVSNTHDVCQQTWKPYSMKLKIGGVNEYYVAQSIVFENAGTTAVLRGTLRSSTWAAAVLTVNFSGGTVVAPSGSPANTLCSGNGIDYTYFTSMSGTIVINGQTLTISRRNAAFQVGNGANLQNVTELGAAGQFILSDSTLGEFGFKLGVPVPCTNTDPTALVVKETPLLLLGAYQNFDKANLTWVNNTGYKNNYFEIQKADEAGNFKTLEIINQGFIDNNRHDYHFMDGKTQKGENKYRVKTVFLDATSLVSESVTLTFMDFETGVLYPNPAKNKVFLGLKDYDKIEVKILIYNNLGSLQKQFTLVNNPDVPMDLNIENLNVGTYFMRIVAQGKEDLVKQFVVEY